MRRTTVRRSPRRTGPSRALAPIATLALVALAATACSDDDGGDDSDDGDERQAPLAALTSAQIDEALLQAENLGEGWTSAPGTESDTDAPGCLGDLGRLIDQLVTKDDESVEFTYGEVLTVESSVSSYESEPEVASVFKQVKDVAAACTDVTGSDEEGNSWDLTLTASSDAVHDDVDDQLSLSATGTFTTPDGQQVPIHVEQATVRLGPNVASLSTIDVQDRATEHAVWAEIAVERFVDVVEGEEPEPTTAPAPAAG